MLGDPGRNFKAFSILVPEIPKHHFCHILLIKQVTKASPDTRGEGLDSASYWWSVRITFETSMWNEDYHCSYLDSSVGKESDCNAGDPGSIPGSGTSTGEGIGYILQYSGLENSMDCIVPGVAELGMIE